MDNFPGGLFPEGAFDYEFYKGNLHAKWASRYDEQGIHMRVQVEHTYHIAERADIEGFHSQDAIKIALKGKPGFRNTMVAMTLLSTTGKPSWGFHRSSNEEKYPIGEYPDLPARIVREGKTTTYDVLYTWDMLSLDKVPDKHTYLPLSIAVFCKDPSTPVYGLQWFFGILYNSVEGKEEVMGKVWVV
jgi:hypothetical protein